MRLTHLQWGFWSFDFDIELSTAENSLEQCYQERGLATIHDLHQTFKIGEILAISKDGVNFLDL